MDIEGTATRCAARAGGRWRSSHRQRRPHRLLQAPRDAMPGRPARRCPTSWQDPAGLFDHRTASRGFVKPIGEHRARESPRSIRHHLLGLHLAHNEQRVAPRPGVTAVDINYATRRACAGTSAASLSDILAAIPGHRLPGLSLRRGPLGRSPSVQRPAHNGGCSCPASG